MSTRFLLAPAGLILALALLVAGLLALAHPTAAQGPPAREVLDIPLEFRLDYPQETDATVRIVWDEEGRSDAHLRYLTSSRRGLLWSERVPYPGAPPRSFYVVYVSIDQWRPGDRLTLCRSWPEEFDPVTRTIRPAVLSCHDRWPSVENAVFLPLLSSPWIP